MNPNIKQKWVEALRSNNYKQGRANLRTGDRFCCLGVLCDLYAKEKGVEWINYERTIEHENIQFVIDKEITFLPRTVTSWAELNSTNPHFDTLSLTALNDSGTSFEEIARIIEANDETF